MTEFKRFNNTVFGPVIMVPAIDPKSTSCEGCVGTRHDCHTLPRCRYNNSTYIFIHDTDEALAEHIANRMNGAYLS